MVMQKIYDIDVKRMGVKCISKQGKVYWARFNGSWFDIEKATDFLKHEPLWAEIFFADKSGPHMVGCEGFDNDKGEQKSQGLCPNSYTCRCCGERMEKSGDYRICPRCGYDCRWFTNNSGLGMNAETLDYLSTLPDGGYDRDIWDDQDYR